MILENETMLERLHQLEQNVVELKKFKDQYNVEIVKDEIFL